MIRSNSIAPQILDIESIARKAETIPGAMVYASDLPKTYLIRLTSEEALIVTAKNGYLRLKAKNIKPLIEELENILEDINNERG